MTNRTSLLQRWLESIWYSEKKCIKNRLSLCLLIPLSFLYKAVNKYQRETQTKNLAILSCPVIVVGNITVGGTGKTPLVIKLVELLKKSGYKPAIITRGYGGEATEWPQYVQANSNPNIVGDEAVLMAKRTFVPVYAGANRLASIDQLLKAHPCDVIISDDGMQHYKLPRDIQIAVIDAQRQLGNGYCLPAGPLREKKERLKTCDFIVVNGGISTDFSILNQDVESYCTNMNLSGKTLINLSSNKEKPISDFTGKKVQALTGIGNPQRFYLTLRKHDIHVTENSFPDHHAFTQDDLAFDRDEVILMTEKDAVKCQSLIKDSNAYWYLPVSADLSEEFETKIIEALDRVSVKSNAK